MMFSAPFFKQVRLGRLLRLQCGGPEPEYWRHFGFEWGKFGFWIFANGYWFGVAW